MVFKKYNSRNDAVCLLQTAINETSTTMIAKGAFNRFSTTNFIVKVTQKDITGVVIARENMYISTRVGNTFNISQRSYEEVPTTDESTSNVLQAVAFPADAVIEEVFSSEVLKDIQEEITQVREDFVAEDITLLKNPILSSKSANYTLLSTEKNNTVFSMSTAGGNRTFTLNPALFPTTNGCFVFTFVKSDSSANTVTIDVGSGNLIDIEQTYILLQNKESVTIQVQSSTFAKVIATSNKTPNIVVENTKSSITLGENVSAGDYLSLGTYIDNTLNIGNTVLNSQQANGSVGQTFTTPNNGDNKLRSSTFNCSSTSAGALQTVTAKIYSSVGGTLLGTSNTLIFSDTTLQARTFTFPTVVSLNGNTQYYLVFDIISASANIRWYSSNTNTYSGGDMYQNGVIVTNKDLNTTIDLYSVGNTSKFYKTSASNILTTKYRGYAETSGVADGVIKMITGPVDSFRTGLTAGAKMYLSDTAGAISSTPGTVSVEVGTAISSTAIQMNTYSDYTVIPSSVILGSSNSSVSNTSLSYSKLKEIEIKVDGIYTIDFTLTHSPNGTYISYGRIFKNGISFGTERSSSSSTPATYSEDLTFKKGDLVQIYAYGNNAGSTNSISNFGVKGLPILRDFIPVTII